METGTLMMIEFLAFFGGILAFGFQQLHSLKKLARLDEANRSGQPADGKLQTTSAAPQSQIPSWLARR